MKINKKICITFIAALVLAVATAPVILACHHDETFITTIKEATCTETGQEDVICAECGKVLESRTLDLLDHIFGDFVVVEKPSADKNGMEIRTCSVCLAEDRREIKCPHEIISTFIVREATCGEVGREVVICESCDKILESRTLETLPHEVTYTSVIHEATCAETGLEATICEACGSTVEERVLEVLDCSYGDWIYTKYATPFEEGERHKECSVCSRTISETYAVTMAGENSIYIPGTEINHCFNIGGFTQTNVNRYDILYTDKAYASQDETNPFILGHNYGTLGNLSKTELGQYIYLSVNGSIETYKVVVSEYAIEDSRGITMIGQTTGTNIWDTLNSEIPNSRTSYGGNHQGKTLWETHDGKTLHMYTCYGNRSGGRWIVLAALVS